MADASMRYYGFIGSRHSRGTSEGFLDRKGGRIADEQVAATTLDGGHAGGRNETQPLNRGVEWPRRI